MHQDNLDFHLHYLRVCPQDCCTSTFDIRPRSPVINCQKVCTRAEIDVAAGHQVKQDYIHDPKMKETCACNCEYCRSGLTVHSHSKLDCVVHCRNSADYEFYK